eukprot:GHRR01023054.1.p1 GENE.GHRR01023054.1~~GHRR01023054.1.p1  ORF type:complete len:299 (+),score=98.98 GHRR01023054.1:450-1346(+)
MVVDEDAAAAALTACSRQDIEQVLLAAELDEHYGVAVDFISLLQENAQLAGNLVQQPQQLLDLLECALLTAQEMMLQQHPQQQIMAVKPNAHVRLHNLPHSLDPEPNMLNPTISNIGSRHLGKLVTIRGTVVKAGPVKMLEAQKMFICNKCKHRFMARNNPDNNSKSGSGYDLPMECPSLGPRPCLGTNFKPVDEQGATCYTNHQEIRVQEQMQCLEPGSVPANIQVLLQDELADSCQPGGKLRPGFNNPHNHTASGWLQSIAECWSGYINPMQQRVVDNAIEAVSTAIGPHRRSQLL